MIANSHSKIAVCSRSFSRHPVLRAELTQKYSDVTFNDEGLSLSGPSLINFLSGHERAITALEVLDEIIFRSLPNLKVISKYGVGVDMIDIEAMAARGIRLGWTGGVNKRSVSELVISTAISLLRHVPEANAEVRADIWRQHKGRQVSGKTIGIVGCGHVGKDLTQLLQSFDCRILTHDILDFPEFYAQHNVTPVSLDELLAQSDIVTLHLPLDETTTNILNAEKLALMKDDALLINIARGGLVDEEAVKQLLISGQLAGAAFDVFAKEPPEDQELLNLPNFLALPHIGGSSEEAILAMGRAAIEGLETATVPDPSFRG